MSPYLKIARFDHWIKQFFIIPGAGLAWVMSTMQDKSMLSQVSSGKEKSSVRCRETEDKLDLF